MTIRMIAWVIILVLMFAQSRRDHKVPMNAGEISKE